MPRPFPPRAVARPVRISLPLAELAVMGAAFLLLAWAGG